jgi:hypothetical protein
VLDEEEAAAAARVTGMAVERYWRGGEEGRREGGRVTKN